VTGGPDLTLHEVQEAANVIYSAVSDDANIIFGAVLDDRLHGEVLITVIATGFDMATQAQNQYNARRDQIPITANARPQSEQQQRTIQKTASDYLDIPEFLRARGGNQGNNQNGN
jgi:cell division protein FtsZ